MVVGVVSDSVLVLWLLVVLIVLLEDGVLSLLVICPGVAVLAVLSAVLTVLLVERVLSLRVVGPRVAVLAVLLTELLEVRVL